MRFIEESFQKLLSRYKESGLSVVEFCSNEGIHKSTFYYWLKKSRNKSKKPGTFIPLVVGGQPQVPNRHKEKPHGSINISAMNQPGDVLLELIYPNGTLLRLRKDIDIQLLQELIHLCD
jgi:transposase-like protein